MEKLHIKDLSIDALLELDVAHIPEVDFGVDNWVNSEGLYPGSVRVAGTELYQCYVGWCWQQIDQGHGTTQEILVASIWAKGMKHRFKSGLINGRRVYWVSRQEVPEIPDGLIE